MRWFIVPLALGWIIFCIVAGRALRVMPGPARVLLALIFMGSFVGIGYVVTEFAINKGPDDWGAMWHAGYPLSEKYGKFQECSYTVQSFDKDADGSGSGTYHVHFRYNDHSGVILCHYDKAAHKFDSDTVQEDN